MGLGKLGVPWPYSLTGAADKVEHLLQNSKVALALDDWLLDQQLTHDATDRPHVNGRGVRGRLDCHTNTHSPTG